MFLSKGIILLSFFSANLAFAKVELIQSDYGTEKCDSHKAKMLDGKFYEKVCGGENLIPSVEWMDKNNATKSYVVTVTSPRGASSTGCVNGLRNCNGEVHFIVWNIPPYVNSINHSVDFHEMGATTGLNSHGRRGYNGPCSIIPPSKAIGCMKFTLYALKTEHIELSQDADYFELMAPLKTTSRWKGSVIDSLTLYAPFIPKKNV
ncbi:phosphatidylethanolamine-binding protein, putative [Plasmodium ovale]|uniref:Phosphatidylethanolamine-binding protein, putative n=1 Tax=Plasmodium ovale TaxID=36330 RepID=A0A1D3THG4_PLAOA|nr:phosphatidylethanolamine-binding protein, putative [Plasmodium ovale]